MLVERWLLVAGCWLLVADVAIQDVDSLAIAHIIEHICLRMRYGVWGK